MILLDAARADRFGYAGYPRETSPHLDALARSGLVAPAHFSHDTHTRGSLPSLFYSRYFAKALFPTSDAVPYDTPDSLMRRLDDEVISLSRALSADGFTTAAISAHSWLKPATPFGREFDELIDLSVETRSYAPPAERVIDRALDWIEEHRDHDFFLYLHLMDTHFPHAFGEEAEAFWGSEETRPPGLDGHHKTFARLETLDRDERRFLDALYDGSLLHADREIGRLVSYLDREGLTRDTLIAVTSDHGENLLETPGRFAHGGPWIDTVSHIPLIFHQPSRLEPGVVPGFSGLVDVEPTMLGLLGVAIPPGRSMDGRDLVAVARGELSAREAVLSPFGIRTNRYKLLVDHPKAVLETASDEPVESVTVRLFDLEQDPEELQDIASRDPETVARLIAAYRKELAPKWNRFASASNHSQPESAFAIGARDFEFASGVGADVDIVGEAESTGHVGKGDEAGWRQLRHWRDDWIAGRAGAEPLDIFFPLPDGEYEVMAHVSGSGAIELIGAPPTVVSETPGGGRDRRLWIGRTEVRGERFQARLHAPEESGELRIHLLGFRPGADPSRDDAANELHLEQLRALGYVE